MDRNGCFVHSFLFSFRLFLPTSLVTLTLQSLMLVPASPSMTTLSNLSPGKLKKKKKLKIDVARVGHKLYIE